jgi:TrmH family RNA methyltransferase
MGAVFRLKISIVEDTVFSVKELEASGRRVFAAELRDNARSLREVEVKESDVFVIGNEGHGIDTFLSQACTSSVYIPIDDRSESLNAAVAACVLMWEQSTAKQ